MPKIHVMMKLQGDHPDVVVDSLRRSGITVYGRLGNIVTASLSESDMSRVASNHCIQGITSGGRVHSSLLSASSGFQEDCCSRVF